MTSVICQLNDIPENSAREFTVNEQAVVIYRKGQQVFGYRNICPHIGTPLNWMPDQFMDFDKKNIQCTTHGALFEPKTGQCIAGPCAGNQLSKVELKLDQGQVYRA